jgi:hypothetical protein
MPTTSKIVIKIKDEFFLQNETVVANPGKIVIDGNFFHDFNYGRVNELYPMLKNAGNISESKGVFSNLITQIAPKDVNGKIESLFSVEDSTNVVNLMQMAKDRNDEDKDKSNDIGENLLNYYFIEVDSDNAIRKLEELNELKSPNSGIDYFYLRGTLTNFEQQSASQSTGDVLQPDNVRVGVAKRFPKSFVNRLQPEAIAMNMMASSATPIPQSNPVSRVGTFNPPPPPPLPPLADVKPIHSIFNTFGIVVGTNLASTTPTIKVVDMEQGWNFDTPIQYAGFPPSTTRPILGGGVNNSDLKHGQKTLNVLLGKENPTDSIATLNGLCLGANVRVASTHYTQGERREAALASVLGYGYQYITKDGKMADEMTESNTKPLNLYDIVLLELQVTITYKIYPVPVPTHQKPLPDYVASSLFPVEIEPAMWNVIDKGVKAKYIIIEAAGNGSNNLNTNFSSPFSTLKDITTKNTGTGAIMVGAFDRNFQPKLNNGNRLDYRCFGDDVITSADISGQNITAADKPFNNTSLASAITTALVANFQSMAQAMPNVNRRLRINEIRKLLEIPMPFNTFISTYGITKTKFLP